MGPSPEIHAQALHGDDDSTKGNAGTTGARTRPEVHVYGTPATQDDVSGVTEAGGVNTTVLRAFPRQRMRWNYEGKAPILRFTRQRDGGAIRGSPHHPTSPETVTDDFEPFRVAPGEGGSREYVFLEWKKLPEE